MNELCGYELTEGDGDQWYEHYGPCELPRGHDGPHRETREWETESPTGAEMCDAFGHHWGEPRVIPWAHVYGKIRTCQQWQCERCHALKDDRPGEGWITWSLAEDGPPDEGTTVGSVRASWDGKWDAGMGQEVVQRDGEWVLVGEPWTEEEANKLGVFFVTVTSAPGSLVEPRIEP